MSIRRILPVLCALLLTCAFASAETAVPELQGEWLMIGVEGPDADDVAFAIDDFVLTLTGDELTMAYGDSTQTTTYKVVGNTLVFNGVADPFELQGDTLRLVENGTTMIFTRMHGPKLQGEWVMTGVEGPNAAEFNFAVGKFVLTLTENELTMAYGDSVETTSYSVMDNAIVFNGVTDTYVLEGDTLRLVEDGNTLIFTRIIAKEQAADSAALIGRWVLVGAGNEETVLPEGYTASIIITEDTLTSTYVLDGEEKSVSAPYILEGNMILSEVSEMTWMLEGDVLTLTEYGICLQFVRAE